MYISHERKMGGANLCLFELAKEMKARGHEVYVTVLFKNCPLAVELNKNGINTIPAFFGWWQMPRRWNPLLKAVFWFLYCLEWFQKLRLSYVVKEKEIDIIHSNSSCIDLGLKISMKTGIPHVWHFREFGDADYNLEYLYGRDKSISIINKNAENIIFISESLRNYYGDIKNSKRRVVIYDGISEKYLINKRYSAEKPIVFLVTGNLSRNKNQKLVLEAALILKQKGIYDFRVLVAGAASSLTESQKYEKELRDYKGKYKLDQVEFLGYIKDMNQIRRVANVEIIASVKEAFGRVTVEAMFAGNPVIASDSGANIELIDNKKNGLLFEMDNANSLAEKMEYFIKHSSEIEPMGRYGKNIGIKKYMLQNSTNSIEEFYFKMI